MVQSSSVTTLTVLGFVSAGLMTFTQLTGAITSANVGTRVTAQMIVSNVAEHGCPVKSPLDSAVYGKV